MHMNCKSRIMKHPAGLREAVWHLIAFFDVLNRPVTYDDFKRYLRESGFDSGGLKRVLLAEDGIESDGTFYFLKGRGAIVEAYMDNREIERQYMDKANKYVSLLRHVPFVRAVALCNNLSFGCVDEDSDIDLFVIVREGRIFTARILSTLLFHILGIRRYGVKVRGRFCLSFFVAGSNFVLEDIAVDNDCYLHFWGRYLIPVIGKAELWNFKLFNRDFLDLKMSDEFNGDDERRSFFRDFFEWLLSGSVGDFPEGQLEKWHLKRLAKRKDISNKDFGVVINEKMLKFHNRDRRKEYSKLFLERLDGI